MSSEDTSILMCVSESLCEGFCVCGNLTRDACFRIGLCVGVHGCECGRVHLVMSSS